MTNSIVAARWPRRFWISALVLANALVLLTSPGWALVQRIEAVGIYGIEEKLRSSVVARDKAIEQGIREGVSQVAAELLPSGTADQEALRAALGSDVLPYARSFRILKDRGERAAQMSQPAGVTREYVVLVEAIVDVDRVKSALASQGLLAASSGISTGRGTPVLLELVGVMRFPAFEAVRAALDSKLGATRVETLGFARGRQLLAVEGPFGPTEVYTALADLKAEGVQLRGVGVDEAGRRVRFEGVEVP